MYKTRRKHANIIYVFFISICAANTDTASVWKLVTISHFVIILLKNVFIHVWISQYLRVNEAGESWHNILNVSSWHKELKRAKNMTSEVTYSWWCFPRWRSSQTMDGWGAKTATVRRFQTFSTKTKHDRTVFVGQRNGDNKSAMCNTFPQSPLGPSSSH